MGGVWKDSDILKSNVKFVKWYFSTPKWKVGWYAKKLQKLLLMLFCIIKFGESPNLKKKISAWEMLRLISKNPAWNVEKNVLLFLNEMKSQSVSRLFYEGTPE